MASPQCSSSMARPSGSNRLLQTLIVFSLVVHAGIFIHISGIYRSSALNYFEVTVQNIARPVPRNIPRPRPRPKMPSPADAAKKLDVVQRPLPRVRPLATAPVDSSLPDTLMEAISAPDVPQTPGVDSSDWVPGPHTEKAADELMTAASYLDMVRLKIESRKRYPDSAKVRGIEGRVTIRFILTGDGTVRDLAVAKRSRSDALNTAALSAVRNAAPFPRPPANIFKKDQALELTIVFELT